MKRNDATPTTVESTVSHSDNTTNCTNSNRAAAQYAYDTLKSSQDVLLSITITRQEKSEDCFVTTVTTESSEGTQTHTFYDGWLNTLRGKPDGSPRKK